LELGNLIVQIEASRQFIVLSAFLKFNGFGGGEDKGLGEVNSRQLVVAISELMCIISRVLIN
jgi:hypothetical protein